jgi:glycosyltransferase involved in cell wall biosynthesis
MSCRPKIAVLVATFRRPQQLMLLLDSLGEQVNPPDFDIIVVDNDPARTGIIALGGRRSYSGHRITVAHEPIAGIAAARNRALDLASHYSYVCFVDDDEVVDQNWLANMMRAFDLYAADVVSGPVRSVFVSPVPRWAVSGKFFGSAPFVTGQLMRDAATNNIAFRRSALERFGPARFDSRFSEAGGSDIFLTAQLATGGARIVWDDSVVVTEIVPPARCSPSWIQLRAIRTGGSYARVRLWRTDKGPGQPGGFRRRCLVAGLGLLRIIAGLLALASAPRITLNARGAMGYKRLLRGIGFVGVAVGLYVREYKRGG